MDSTSSDPREETLVKQGGLLFALLERRVFRAS